MCVCVCLVMLIYDTQLLLLLLLLRTTSNFFGQIMPEVVVVVVVVWQPRNNIGLDYALHTS